MSKLVDKERLAQLAKALDTRMKAAVQAEKERAMAAEQAVDGKADANAAAIAAINNEETGLLVQAAADAAAKVQVEKERAEGIEGNLNTRLAAMESTLDGAADDFFKDAAEGTTVKQMVADIAENAKQIGVNAKAIADEKSRAEAKENEIVQAMEAETARVNKKIADDIAAESALRVAEEAKIRQELANEKAALQQEIDDDIAAEAALRAAEEVKIRQELANEKAALQAEIDADVKVEKERAEGKEAELLQAIQDEAATARAAEKLNKDAIDVLNGDENKEGSVKKQIADAIAGVKSEVTDGLDDKVEVLEGKMTTAEADIDAVEAKLAGLEKDTVQASIDAAQADAEAKAAELDATLKQELEEKIEDDVQVVADELAKQKDAAQEGSLAHQIKVEKERMDAFLKDADVQDKAVDTLKEIQEYINTHGEAAQKMVEDIAANKTAIETEAAEARKQEGLIRGELAAEKAALQKEIDDDVKAVVDAQTLVNNGFEGRIAANEAFVAAQPAVDEAQDNRIKALEDASKEGGATAQAIATAQAAAEAAQKAANDEKVRAEAQEAAIRGELAVEKKALQDEIDADVAAAVGVYASEGVEASGLRKEIAEKDAAVRAAFAQADSDLHETIKSEMAAIVQSLQAEITSDGKLKLSLGGGDTVVAICEKELPFATEQDIKDIIDGLDA